MAAESKLERECRDYTEHALDGKLVKASIVGQNGWPDRMLLVPGCPIVFIEFKGPGKRPSASQKRWAHWLKSKGFLHWVIDDWDKFLLLTNALRTLQRRGDWSC